MAKQIVYDWVIEVVEGSMLVSLTADYDIIESWQYQTAAAMIQHLKGEEDSEKQWHNPVLVRDVLDHHGSVLCRSWAYLHRLENGAWGGLPDKFCDAVGDPVADVPAYQRKALRQALANI